MFRSIFIASSATLIVALTQLSAVQANDALPYDSLKDFCIASGADTEANCICGQATADRIMSQEEQRLVLGMMLQDPASMQKMQSLGPGMMALMEKVEQVTAGCQ